ncbi:ATP-binding protein [Streptomyces lavendulae]|uniref:ATP-binding protein n=1 Tax=Streptomyces lavendulae TaxID=1914 RepID=UPI0033D1A028
MNALRLSAALTSLEDVARYVLDLAERAGLTEEASYRLRLATDELATNVVMHGYHGSEGELRIEGGMDEDTVWIRLEDDAPAFDPAAHCLPPDITVPLAERAIGGLGIHLALTSVDEFTYTCTGARNRTTLVMRRHDPTGAPTKQHKNEE